MLRIPLSKPPSHCSLCELRHDHCDICPSRKTHCMKYHVEIIPFIRPCEWRATVTHEGVVNALAFANDQLREFYVMQHDAKQKGRRMTKKPRPRKTTRGLTRRLTITPDFFRGQ